MTEQNESGLYIVLVDDEPRIHETVRDIIETARLADIIEDYYDPVDFIESLKQAGRLPDVILLDVHFENSGLSGLDIIPYIREDHPYLPIILLTGMEGDVIDSAQNYECLYYIPKPVSPEHLVRMVRFYVGRGQKSGQRTAELTRDLAEHKSQVQLLSKELAQVEIASWDKQQDAPSDLRPFHRIVDILQTILKNSTLMDSMLEDLEKLYSADFSMLKKTIDTLVRFDLTDFSSPGLNLHKYKGVQNVFSMRISHKARIFFYQESHNEPRRLLRLDPEHDTDGMLKWLKSNYDSFKKHLV